MLNIDDGQMDFFDGDDPQILADFNKWVHTPGGRHIANRLFRKAAAYVADYERYGIQVSMKLLWELQRHEINKTRARMGGQDPRIVNSYGYTLNNNYHRYMAKFIIKRRPAWDGIFKFRDQRSKITEKEGNRRVHAHLSDVLREIKEHATK